jgi:hypothetical protein
MPVSLGKLSTFAICARASVKRVWRNGVLTVIANDAFPFDYYPLTGKPRGLLIEEARTNLLTYSNGFSDAAWAATNATLAQNATGPDGAANSAWTMTDDATSGAHQTRQLIPVATLASGAIFTVSAWVKAGTLGSTALRVYDNTTANHYVTAVFDLSDSAAVQASQTSVGGSSGTITRTRIEHYDNGWKRLVLSGSGITVAANYSVSVFSAAAPTGNTFNSFGAPTYAGSGSTVVIYGAQVEANDTPSSYIATTTAAATRQADDITVPYASIAALLPECLVFAEWEIAHLTASANNTVLAVDGGNTNNQILIAADLGAGGGLSGKPYLRVRSGGTTVASFNLSSWPTQGNGTISRAAIGAKLDNYNGAVDGTLAGEDVSGAMPASLSNVRVGRASNGNWLNGWVRRFGVTPYRKTDWAVLQSSSQQA